MHFIQAVNLTRLGLIKMFVDLVARYFIEPRRNGHTTKFIFVNMAQSDQESLRAEIGRQILVISLCEDVIENAVKIFFVQRTKCSRILLCPINDLVLTPY